MMFRKKKELYCYECECLLYRAAKTVPADEGDRAFCASHKPPYDRVQLFGLYRRYFRHQPDLEVTRDGEPVAKEGI